MNSLIYSDKLTVKGHDVNVNKTMTIPALINSLQEASLQHARALKTSAWDMSEEKMTWVLVRKEMKIISHLELDQQYTILTYPSGFDKFLAYRDYLIFDSNKKLVVGASSTWTLIDTDTRKLMKIPSKILEIGVPKETRFLTQPEKSINLPNELKQLESRKVHPYDLDWNNHVNNIVLIRFMMESIKRQGIEDDQVQKVLVHFKNELKIDEIVDIHQSHTAPDYYTILKETQSNKEIAVGKITLLNAV